MISYHGGPEGQSRPYFSYTFQAFLSQGIAVFSPNVRGSSGFGKKFVNLDNGPLRFNGIKDIQAAMEMLGLEYLQPLLRYLLLLSSERTPVPLANTPCLRRFTPLVFLLPNFALFGVKAVAKLKAGIPGILDISTLDKTKP